jgi:hypothetical protein
MSINASGWRPEMGGSEDGAVETFTGNRALMLEEALIFERDNFGGTGVELPAAPEVASRLAGPERAGNGAALYPSEPAELCDRSRRVPAGFVHDEA